MNRKLIDKTEPDKPKRRDVQDALKDVLLSLAPDRPRSDNQEPTREKFNQRWKLDRR